MNAQSTHNMPTAWIWNLCLCCPPMYVYYNFSSTYIQIIIKKDVCDFEMTPIQSVSNFN